MARTMIEAEVRNRIARAKHSLPSLPDIVGRHFDGFMSHIACRMIRINDYTGMTVRVSKNQRVHITIPVFVQAWNTKTDDGWLREEEGTIVFHMAGLGKELIPSYANLTTGFRVVGSNS